MIASDMGQNKLSLNIIAPERVVIKARHYPALPLFIRVRKKAATVVQGYRLTSLVRDALR